MLVKATDETLLHCRSFPLPRQPPCGSTSLWLNARALSCRPWRYCAPCVLYLTTADERQDSPADTTRPSSPVEDLPSESSQPRAETPPPTNTRTLRNQTSAAVTRTTSRTLSKRKAGEQSSGGLADAKDEYGLRLACARTAGENISILRGNERTLAAEIASVRRMALSSGTSNQRLMLSLTNLCFRADDHDTRIDRLDNTYTSLVARFEARLEAMESSLGSQLSGVANSVAANSLTCTELERHIAHLYSRLPKVTLVSGTNKTPTAARATVVPPLSASLPTPNSSLPPLPQPRTAQRMDAPPPAKRARTDLGQGGPQPIVGRDNFVQCSSTSPAIASHPPKPTTVRMGPAGWNASDFYGQVYEVAAPIFNNHAHLKSAMTDIRLDNNAEYMNLSFRTRASAKIFTNAWKDVRPDGWQAVSATFA